MHSLNWKIVLNIKTSLVVGFFLIALVKLGKKKNRNPLVFFQIFPVPHDKIPGILLDSFYPPFAFIRCMKPIHKS